MIPRSTNSKSWCKGAVEVFNLWEIEIIFSKWKDENRKSKVENGCRTINSLIFFFNLYVVGDILKGNFGIVFNQKTSSLFEGMKFCTVFFSHKICNKTKHLCFCDCFVAEISLFTKNYPFSFSKTTRYSIFSC